MNKILNTFRSLKYKNFRLFFPGLIISQIGIWIQNIAIGWIIYNLTKSPLIMGIIMCTNAIPLFIITPFAGVIIDKFNRHKMLITIQILFAIQAFLIAFVTLSDFIRVWNIILLGLFINTIAAIDVPLRQSMFVYLVEDKNDLSNAISLNATCFNVARLVGPALAGILIASVGEGICFLINFICIIPAIILVSFMDIKEEKSEHVKNETIIEGLKEGIKYVVFDKRLMTLMCFLLIFAFIGMTYPMLMPVYTKEIFKSNADILGYLMASAGVGALVSSLILASKNTVQGFKYILCSGAFLFSVCMIILGFSSNIILSITTMFFLGLGMTACITSDNTIMQSIIDNEVRGRVMSIHAICYMGSVSLSSLVAGFVAEHIGIGSTLILYGVLLLISSFIFLYLFKHISFEN